MTQNHQYDLLLKAGHVIDPLNHIDGIMDVAIAGGKIAAVEADINPALAVQTIDVSGQIVTPGLIDIHVHVYHTREPEGLSVMADSHSFRSGVTTMVDTGTAGAKNFLHFKRTCIDLAKTRIFAYVNIVDLGMIGDFEQDVTHHGPRVCRLSGDGLSRRLRGHQDRPLLDATAVGRRASAMGRGRQRGGRRRHLRQAGHVRLLAAPARTQLSATDPGEGAAGRHPYPCLCPAVPHHR